MISYPKKLFDAIFIDPYTLPLSMECRVLIALLPMIYEKWKQNPQSVNMDYVHGLGKALLESHKN